MGGAFSCILALVFSVWSWQTYFFWLEHRETSSAGWLAPLITGMVLLGFGIGLMASLAAIYPLEKKVSKA